MDRLSAAAASTAAIIVAATVVAASAIIIAVSGTTAVVSAAAEEEKKDDDPPAAVIVSEHEISPRKFNLYRLKKIFLFHPVCYMICKHSDVGYKAFCNLQYERRTL